MCSPPVKIKLFKSIDGTLHFLSIPGQEWVTGLSIGPGSSCFKHSIDLVNLETRMTRRKEQIKQTWEVSQASRVCPEEKYSQYVLVLDPPPRSPQPTSICQSKQGDRQRPEPAPTQQSFERIVIIETRLDIIGQERHSCVRLSETRANSARWRAMREPCGAEPDLSSHLGSRRD